MSEEKQRRRNDNDNEWRFAIEKDVSGLTVGLNSLASTVEDKFGTVITAVNSLAEKVNSPPAVPYFAIASLCIILITGGAGFVAAYVSPTESKADFAVNAILGAKDAEIQQAYDRGLSAARDEGQETSIVALWQANRQIQEQHLSLLQRIAAIEEYSREHGASQ
tara:strand:- start:10020 stop:10511 length:492 start_codon:yes stop_codon:yes gene_type:complete